MAIADFMTHMSSSKKDYIGFFDFSAGFNQDAVCDTYVKAGDDHKNMMLKTLTDRLAEVYTDQLYQEVRTEIRGYFSEKDASVQ